MTAELRRAAELTTHRWSRDLFTLLADSGWRRVQGGAYLFEHPRSGTEVRTPDFIPKEWWGGETYRVFRQVSLGLSGDKVTLIIAREGRAPWVRVSERVMSFKAAREFIAEPWDPKPAVAPGEEAS